MVHPPDEIVQLSDEELAGYDLVSGHFRAMHLERPVFADYLPVVVLRDPIDRFLSAFNFAKAAVARGRGGPGQRFAVTVGPFEYFTSEFGVERHAHLWSLGLDPGDHARSTPLAKLLDRAKERLSTMVVGVVPHLEPFLAFTARRFGVDPPVAVPTKNVTPAQYRHPDLAEAELAIMRHALRYDYELLDFARRRARALYGSADPAAG
jgi:hypothetical protein